MSIKNVLILATLLMVVGCGGSSSGSESQVVERDDSARQLTFLTNGESSQNPAFSPDGKYLLFTRFLNGYNSPPSELVRLDITTGEQRIIVPAEKGVEHISVPGSAWVDGKICWSSDISGGTNEIYIADDDGTQIEQLTNHPESDGYYIEPTFNPKNRDKIIFEYVLNDNAPHQIALLERDKNGRVTVLTNSDFDDRLPNWSPDGTTILFQRANRGQTDWRIYTAQLDYSSDKPALIDLQKIEQADEDNTDNLWFSDGNHILSSTYWDSDMPNIFAYPTNGLNPIRITKSSSNEDGAPSSSPDGRWVAFESHHGDNERYPSDIWIIRTEKKDFL